MEQFGWGSYGGLSISFVGSYLLEAKTTPRVGEPTYDCAGLFGPQCQTLNPRWRHTLRASWRTPWDVLASVSWRYIGKTTLETDSDQPTIGGSTTDDPFSHRLHDRSYLDVSAIWDVNDMFSVRAGVTNILDQDPPIVPASLAGSGSPNAFTTYDLLGRRMFVGFTANF
jgi:outer membrane receptor for ferrienterochelin and colicin